MTPVPLEAKLNIPKNTLRTILVTLIVLSCFASYFNALLNGFVYDDIFQVVENHWIKNTRYLPDIFMKGVWGFAGGGISSNYYRPVMHLFYMVNYHIFGLRPWGFHLVNILLHTAVSLLVFLVAVFLFRKLKSTSYLAPSFIAAILFATHPIHTEVVTWVAGIPDLSFTLLYLLSFYLYARSQEGGLYSTRRLYVFSLISFFLATFSKETALTLPLVLIAYESVFVKNPGTAVSRLRKVLPYFLVLGVYFMFRVHALKGLAPFKRDADLNTYQVVINIFPLFIQYLERLILPINMNAFYVFHPVASALEPTSLFSILLTMTFVFILCVFYRKNKLAFLSLLFIAFPLLPVLYVPVLGENRFAERYLYLPSFGYVMFIALFIDRIRSNRPKWTLALNMGLWVWIGLYASGTISRNPDWKNDYALWTDTVRKSPDGAIPHNELGNAYASKGATDKAMEHYRMALILKPHNAEAHNNLGLAYSSKGDTDRAIEYYQEALRLRPGSASAHNNLGLVYSSKGDIDTAIEHFQEALRLHPTSPGIHNNLGNVYESKGWTDRAFQHYQKALELDPDYADAHVNLGTFYGATGQIDKAIEHFQVALELKPGDPVTLRNLANAYRLKGWPDKAQEYLQRAKGIEQQRQ